MNFNVRPDDADELAQLRRALEAETDRCVELQRRLEQNSADFDEFVSTAAHNLFQSLRDIDAFSQLVAEGSTGCVDDEVRGFHDRIRKGADDIRQLLKAMVEFAATGIGAPPDNRTDMETVLRQSLLLAQGQIVARSAVVDHEPLGPVIGDADSLVKVLYHLVRNAIEYCGAETPRIHISSVRAGHTWVFAVADNGPGIEPIFQERVFGAFRRLHGKDYPGHGLGLALCRKIIEWHGGRIRVESTGRGCTFCFTLPAAG